MSGIIPISFEGIELVVQADERHEFLMTTKEVAEGYGVSESVIREHKRVHADELVDGKHFIACVRKTDAGKPPVKSTLWTKRGVIRLGFYIKSQRAILFRDFAEDLIIDKDPPQDDALAYKETIMLQNEHLAGMANKLESSKVELIEAQKQIIEAQKQALSAQEFALKLAHSYISQKPKQQINDKQNTRVVNKSEHRKMQDLYWGKMSVEQIAEKTNWSESTVKRHVHGKSAEYFNKKFQGGFA